MKRILSVTATLVCVFFLLSSFSIRENPQDPPRGKKKERHIKVEKIDDNGKKMSLDTIVEDDGIFVWNGDTIGDGKDLKWIDGDEFKMDSIFKNKDMDFEFNIDEDDDGNAFILKSGKTKGFPMIYEFKADGDSSKTYRVKIITDDDNAGDNVFMWHGKNGSDHMMVPPRPARVPRVPDIMFIDKNKSDNVIDLSDPGIISYKKKKIRGDREKITIIREKPDDKKVGKMIRITENKKGDEKQVEVKGKEETENN